MLLIYCVLIQLVKYAAHNSRVLKDAKTALVNGEVRTPSIGSVECSEENNRECNVAVVSRQRALRTPTSTGKKYIPSEEDS